MGETDMDGGPFRVPPPADRRATSRPAEQARWQPEDPQPVKEEEPKVVHRTLPPQYAAKEEKSPKKRFLVPAIAIVAVVILGALGLFAWNNAQNASLAVDAGKYQAVFFTNGQVYFGKLKAFNGDYMKLTDIYYLQTQATGETDSENPQQTSTDQNDVQLIKLGDEIHGPEDSMVISKDQVLFYENLKPDGKVSQSIEQYKKSH